MKKILVAEDDQHLMDMKKILVAEDDQHLSVIYELKLRAEGFDVRLAKDGVAVFQILEYFKPDFILLDLVMPKKDGYQVLQELKQSELYKNIPVMVTSNLSATIEKEKVMSLGIVDYVVKCNLSLDQLSEKIKKHLGILPQ